VKHLLVAPVALPVLIGALQLLLARRGAGVQRLLAIAAVLLLLAIAVLLVALARPGAIWVYAIGDWTAPLGIVLVLDRLSAYMLLLTALVGFGSLRRSREPCQAGEHPCRQHLHQSPHRPFRHGFRRRRGRALVAT
jgi:multicomponent K+:H+ antiporter subunit D